jgi:hypothetical protein
MDTTFEAWVSRNNRSGLIHYISVEAGMDGNRGKEARPDPGTNSRWQAGATGWARVNTFDEFAQQQPPLASGEGGYITFIYVMLCESRNTYDKNTWCQWGIQAGRMCLECQPACLPGARPLPPSLPPPPPHPANEAQAHADKLACTQHDTAQLPSFLVRHLLTVVVLATAWGEPAISLGPLST